MTKVKFKVGDVLRSTDPDEENLEYREEVLAVTKDKVSIFVIDSSDFIDLGMIVEYSYSAFENMEIDHEYVPKLQYQQDLENLLNE